MTSERVGFARFGGKGVNRDTEHLTSTLYDLTHTVTGKLLCCFSALIPSTNDLGCSRKQSTHCRHIYQHLVTIGKQVQDSVDSDSFIDHRTGLTNVGDKE